MKTKELFKERLPDIIFFIIGSILISAIFFIKWHSEKDIPNCEQGDVYEISDWGNCIETGIQERIITKKENLSCKNSGNVKTPIEKQFCEYIPKCTESDWKFSEWSSCEKGKQTRTVEKISQCEGVSPFEKNRSCSVKTTHLFKKGKKEYPTIIEAGTYSKKNHNNLLIIPEGEFKTISLKIITEVSYKIPEYYYILFGIDKQYAVPRALGTSRIFISKKDSKFDTKDYGLFQGIETPKKLEFNLKKVKLAKESKNGAGFNIVDYIKILNNNSGKKLKMTLFLGDGRSMTIKDPKKRIKGTITDAWFEYECAEDSKCSISRNPEILKK